MDALDENYAITGDGEDSDIASEFSESDTEVLEATDAPLQDEEPDAFDDLHAVDVIESDDEEEMSSRPGRLASFDFSNAEWSDKESEEHVQRGAFRQQVGPVTVLPIGASALDFFHLLFTMNILKAIVRETNKYAQQCLQSAGKDPHSFENVTEIELLAYLGLVIAMSLHPLHSIRDYWSTDWVLGVPTLARIMSRSRFEIITRFLHLNDNTSMPARGSPTFDKLQSKTFRRVHTSKLLVAIYATQTVVC